MTDIIKKGETADTVSAPRLAAPSAASPAYTSSYVVIILDITPSMTRQIRGVKQAIRELVPLLADNPELGIVIITFTEGGRSCVCSVSIDIFQDATEVDSFVAGIQIGSVPGRPIVLPGNDQDENSKAAIHTLKELDGDKPTVAFFITDAGYHRNKNDSNTARAEEEYLRGKGVTNTDFYAILDSVLDHFGGNLVVIPVVYRYGQFPPHFVQAYGQMAMTSGSGVVIEPVSFTPQTLALTMGAFVTRMLGSLNRQTDSPAVAPEEMFAGLRLFSTEGMTRVTQETNEALSRPREGDSQALYESAMTRTVTAFKVAWKRRIDVNKVSLLRQLVFGLTAAKYVLAVTTESPLAEDLLNRLRDSYPLLLQAVPEEQRGHIKAAPEVVEALASELSTACGEEGVAREDAQTADAVTFETVRDTLEAALEWEIQAADEDAPSEAAEELEDPLETLFGMVHGVLINVRFPVGPSGKPNFADAWSAMIDRHSFDIISAESAVRLFKAGGESPSWERNLEGEGVARGLTDRREYNGFVPLMDAEDPLKSAVLRIFSGLQVMNLLQMTVLAGSPGGFLPNTYPGVLAATLARVIRTSAGGSWAGVEAGGNSSSTGASGGEANDRLASQMVFSLRSVMGWPAKSTAVRLLEGKADPSNPPSKFLMALCKQSHTGSVEDEATFARMMRLVLNEWVAATIQLYFGKSTPENDSKYYAFVQEMVPLEVLFGKGASLDMDPVQRLHPLEAEDEGRSVVAEDWKSAGLAKLSTTTLYNDIRRLVDRCCAVFDCSDTGYDLDGIVLDYVIYRFRTARYEFVPDERTGTNDTGDAAAAATVTTSGVHEPIEEMGPTAGLLIKILKTALSSELAAMKETRRAHAIDLLKNRVVSVGAITAETRTMELLGKTYALSRTDVPSILDMAGYSEGNLPLVEQLILGPWTPEFPQCLRKQCADIVRNIEAAGGGGGEDSLSARIQEALSRQEICARTSTSNRHGHTADLIYPGPMGWTEIYDEARTANLNATKRRPARILPQMRRYTEFGDKVIRRLEAGGKETAEIGTQVRSALYSYNDANLLRLARSEIEKLDMPGLLDGF